MTGLKCLKFDMSFGSQGWTSPPVAPRLRRQLPAVFTTDPPFQLFSALSHCVLSLPFPALVAGRSDDPAHLCSLVADVRHAVRRGAPIVDAVAFLQVVNVPAELE